MPFNSSLQVRRFSEVQSVMKAEQVICRWRVDALQGERYFNGTNARARMEINLHNDGESDITLRLQSSAGNVSQDDPFTTPPTPFAASFGDVGGTTMTIKAKTNRLIELDLDPTKSFYQLIGSAANTGALLRLQVQATTDVDVLDIPRKVV